MSKKSRNKGYRVEHSLVVVLRDAGIKAHRVPLSGSTDFLKADLVIGKYKAEVKARRAGFKEIYKWIEGRDLLFLKADRRDYLCVMRLETFIQLLKGGGI